ncbi:PREDICTED: WPP domain-associated protein-like isoform X3 [Camelina sativa]|uniref:WPP domain-associated protein-like isoform X1 n=1 Tax=Camelina sativa TaxID=90675 RepID=A0ABM1RN49_CAMSA|nr:PREDICTED: WPP domain-associated protein-like isoform X1 [Camelina sativa]XP_019100439.1 PREDICTED: WPP domain-associated protein-like isoform X3 [Camelina sativa]
MEEEVVMAAENGSLEFHDDSLLSSSALEIDGLLKENENPDVDFLEDLDSYWEDINDRLTISRAVSDSIIRGMVTAIESEAAENIALKDLELSRIKERLLLYHVGSEENESPLIHGKACLDTSDELSQGSLGSLKNEARKQLMMLVKELTNLREYIHVNESDGNLDEKLGLDSSLHETRSKTVDKMLDSLKSILETVVKRRNDMEVPSSWQHEHDCRKEIETLVVTSFVRSLKDEYEQRLLDQKAEFGGNRSLILGNIKEITGLRQELEAIRKSFLDHENGDIEAGEEGDRKRVEKLQRKMSGSLNSVSLVKDNGKHEESSIDFMPENNETLKHMSCDELINHFKIEMNKMKRDHDYKIQDMTEQCFTYKRKYLNLQERGSFTFVGKDKELEALKKKIPFVISKLDKILMEDEKLVSEGKHDADIKRQVDSLLLENLQLKDILSDAAEKMSQLSQAEADHQELIRKLESDVQDSCVEASIYKDVYGCFVTETVGQITCAKKETDLEYCMLKEAYELILEDRASKEARERKDEFEDSCVESVMMEECCSVIYKEALKEAHKKIVELNMHVTEKEETLRSEMVDKERLKLEIHRLGCLVKEKDNLVQTAENSLATERKRFELVSHQINDLQSQIEQQQTEIHDKNEALRVVSARELEKIEGYETKISKLREELELAREGLKEMKNEKRKTEEKLSVAKAEKETLEKQLVSLDLVVPPKLIKGFDILEGLIAEKTQKTNFRLKNMQSQLSDLSHQINEVKGKASTYQQRLEKKCCDLQKAEAEVDLLGDEVETLLDLLEKIYIALDHYSPILKHYPGIIEILKLVRRELSGESKRPLD